MIFIPFALWGRDEWPSEASGKHLVKLAIADEPSGMVEPWSKTRSSKPGWRSGSFRARSWGGFVQGPGNWSSRVSSQAHERLSGAGWERGALVPDARYGLTA